MTGNTRAPRHAAVIGAGMAGIACARTLRQAGWQVTVFEQEGEVGGRMACVDTPFGSFDPGAQYFTVRDARFERALATAPAAHRPWSASTVRVLDAEGRIAAPGLPTREVHWVGTPGMNALLRDWATPLAEAGQLQCDARVTRLERDALAPRRWQLRTRGAGDTQHVYSGFDAVALTLPAPQARALLDASQQGAALARQATAVTIAPCWTLMAAFPQAMQPGLSALGPQWNVARSTHHRIAWLARESSKPGRGSIERWTIQASPAWSQEHLDDTPARVQAKLLKAFGEVTGIRAEPALAEARCWRHAQTLKPLGKPFLWDAAAGLGLGGDWCLGHRVEDAFVSGLELALAMT